MVDSIDQRTLCGHLRALLNGWIKTHEVQGMIGFLSNLRPDHFVNVAKDLATIFTQAFQGSFSLEQALIPHIKIRSYKAGQRNVYGWDWLDHLIQLDPSQPEVQKVWAGLCNLKSAAIIKGLSRAEKDDAYDVIIHRPSVDTNFLSIWKEFVPEFTRLLLSRIPGIDSPRCYTNVWWTTPIGNKGSSYLDSFGVLRPCKRGDYNSLSMHSLRHPAIYRIMREFPDEFASAVFVGAEVKNCKIAIPYPPFEDEETPLSRVTISPKRANKPRVVFVALLPADLMSRPAFHRLELLYRWNIQSADDHDLGRQKVQAHLSKPVRSRYKDLVYSFDQSSFTDNFSYDLIQREIIKSLVQENFLLEYDLAVIDAMNHCWIDASTLRKGHIIRFGTGTGMGTPPSFPLASIANGYLLVLSYLQTHGSYPSWSPDHPCGLITGDDTVAFDSATGEQYKKNCELIGLKLNNSKTMISDKVAEFCGKIITKDGIWDKRKLSDIPNKAALVKTMLYYDKSYQDFLQVYPEDVQQTAKVLENIPQPFGAGEEVTRDRARKDYLSLSPIERVVVCFQQIARLRSYDPSQIHICEKTILEIIARKSSLPIIDFDLEEPKLDSLDRPRRLTPFMESLIREATDLFRTYSHSSLEKLLQASTIINDLYHSLYDLGLFEVIPPEQPVSFSSAKKRNEHNDTLSRVIDYATHSEHSPLQ